jgi:glucose-6-phosphate-specific signal transduction histidine kinase
MLVVTALALPLVGPFALLIWIAGATMLWSSPSWTTSEKTLGTLVWPGGLSLPLVLGLMAGPVVLPTWAGIPLLVVLVAAPIVVAIALLRRANARADAATRAI